MSPSTGSMMRSATPLRAIFRPVCVRTPFKVVTPTTRLGHGVLSITCEQAASSPRYPSSLSPSPLVKRFSAWMRQHRGVTEGTLTTYLPLVQEFLAALGDDAAGYDASRVRGFIFARASRHRHARASPS